MKNKSWEQKEKENMQFKENAKDKIMAEVFLQNFIIKNSDILLLIVGILTYSETLLIGKIKNECKKLKKDKLFIVHNLQSFRKVEQIENYIKETLLNCKAFNLKRHKIINITNEYINNEIEDDYNEEEEEEYDEKNIENIKIDDDEVFENKEINIEKNEMKKKDMREEDTKEGDPSHFYEELYYDKDKKIKYISFNSCK